MVNHLVLAEKDSQHKTCMDCRPDEAQNINSHCETEADVVRHDDIVKQGVTDGNIAVKCHYSQHVTLCNDKNDEEIVSKQYLMLPLRASALTKLSICSSFLNNPPSVSSSGSAAQLLSVCTKAELLSGNCHTKQI